MGAVWSTKTVLVVKIKKIISYYELNYKLMRHILARYKTS